MSPSPWTRIMVRLLGEWRGWFKCPTHGYVHDPLVHNFPPNQRKDCPFGDWSVFV
jgi:hypothetical protein